MYTGKTVRALLLITIGIALLIAACTPTQPTTSPVSPLTPVSPLSSPISPLAAPAVPEDQPAESLAAALNDEAPASW
ncbi:MAG: hypothetical protein RBT47_06020 [Anaerolineae bacterium]|nr:hypothetical protein [Anaerolineae bacterium]